MDFELPKEITDKLAELDAFIEAEIKPLERENMQFFDHRRENARTDWEQRRPPARGMARADQRNGAPRRQGRPSALRPAEILRRPGRLQSRDRGDPRTSRRQGARAAQRPAGRVLDRRQFPDHSRARRLRHARSRRPISKASSPARNTCRSASPSPATAATRPGWRRQAFATAIIGSSTAASAGTARSRARTPISCSRAPRASPARPRASPRSSCRPTRPATTFSTITGPSTCRATTPRPS